MKKLYIATRAKLADFRHAVDGASLVEYGLLVGLIAVISIAAVTLLGTQINTLFGDVTGALE